MLGNRKANICGNLQILQCSFVKNFALLVENFFSIVRIYIATVMSYKNPENETR